MSRTPEDSPLEFKERIRALEEECRYLRSDLSLAREVLQAITQIHSSVQTSDVDTVLDAILEHASLIMRANECSVMLVDAFDQHLNIRATKGLNQDDYEYTPIKLGEGICGWVADNGKPLIVSDVENCPLDLKVNDHIYGGQPLIVMPLKIGDRTIGVLSVGGRASGERFTLEDQNVLGMFSAQAAVMIENFNLYERLEQLAVTDGLSGLYVHRYFQEKMAEEVGRARRYVRSVSVAMIDVDRFKKVNDEWGHRAGDLVLREVAKIIKDEARAQDIVARYGGEEFAIIMPETGQEGALMAADRICRTVEQNRFRVCNTFIPITVSGGVSTYPNDGENCETLLEVADRAMYRAKESGCNRVCTLDGCRVLIE